MAHSLHGTQPSWHTAFMAHSLHGTQPSWHIAKALLVLLLLAIRRPKIEQKLYSIDKGTRAHSVPPADRRVGTKPGTQPSSRLLLLVHLAQ
jgi:hypothetical protein